MIAPSGNGSCPFREASIAMSFPKIARKSLRPPSSWATEINLQSRYPEGILTPEIGATSPSDCPDAGPMSATTPGSAPAATSTKTIRPMRPPAIITKQSQIGSRSAQGSECGADLLREKLRLLPTREVDLAKAHEGRGLPACSRTMYSAYQS